MCTDGTLEGAVRAQNELGSKAFVLLHIASKPQNEKNVNDFAIACNSDNVYSFGSAHPYSGAYRYELARLKDAGIKGVKFHSEFQGYEMDDKNAYPLYEMCAEMGFIMFFHGGFDPNYPTGDRARPSRAAKIAHDFAGAVLVFAHLGDVNDRGETLEFLCGKDVFLDTSMIHQHMLKNHARDIIKAHGTHRVLFGTDMPTGGSESVQYLKSLNLAASDYERIFYKNAEKLLNIKTHRT